MGQTPLRPLPIPGPAAPPGTVGVKNLYFPWAVSQLKLITACLLDSCCFICGPRPSLGRKTSRSGHCLRVCAARGGGGEVRREVRTSVQICKNSSKYLPPSLPVIALEKPTERYPPTPPLPPVEPIFKHLSITSIQFQPRTSLAK